MPGALSHSRGSHVFVLALVISCLLAACLTKCQRNSKSHNPTKQGLISMAW
jgi:hypothetical protein